MLPAEELAACTCRTSYGEGDVVMGLVCGEARLRMRVA